MPFLLITGLIFIILPMLIILVLSVVTLVYFLKDDKQAESLLNMMLGAMGFGLLLVLIHFAMRLTDVLM